MRIPLLSLSILTAFFLAPLSCWRKDTIPEIDKQEILLSTGWKLDTYIFRFKDGQPDVELDTLVLNIIRTDTLEDTRSVYTSRWIVFDTESYAVTAFNYDLYSRNKEDSVWIRKETDLTGEGFTEWGLDQRLQPYLNLNSERPIRIDLLNEQAFALVDAYLIESAQRIAFGKDSIKYTFGTFDPKSLLRIDAIYRAAGREDGPNWFPAWRFWPL